MPGLVLQPVDQAVAMVLAQQLTCWAKTTRGSIDPLVHYSGDCVSPSGATVGVWMVDAALCDRYGPLPFTANSGQTIPCNPDTTGFISYLVYPVDVSSVDPNDCPVPAPVRTPVLHAVIEREAGADAYTAQTTVTSWNTDKTIEVDWDDGAESAIIPPDPVTHRYDFDGAYEPVIFYTDQTESITLPITIPFEEA